MAVYCYKARDAAGKSVEGEMEADSKGAIIEKLRKLGYLPTQVAEPFAALHRDSVFDGLRPLRAEDLAAFNFQLANLLRAGIPLLSVLRTISRQITPRSLRRAVESVSRAVEAGESFSDTLSHHPGIFPKLFVTLARVGEASGKLDQILGRYAAYCEQQIEFRRKVQGATLYPAVLLVAALGVVLFVVTTLIPQFVQIFLNAGVHLPFPTLILYQVGISLRQFWLSVVFFAAAGGVAFQYYANTSIGRLQVDRVKLRLPLVGPLHRKAAVSRFGRTLGVLVASGVPILPSLEIVRSVVGNEVLARVVDKVRASVEKGEKISELLRISGEFPPDAVQMILVGEETGSLDEMLDRIADFYDRAVDHNVKQLTVLLEPLLLLVMGGLVGLIMASLLLPMFDMLKIIRR